MRDIDNTREGSCASITDALLARGWIAVRNFLDPLPLARLAAECRALWDEGAFRRAGVGVGPTWRIRPEVRGDYVRWLDPAHLSPAQGHYFEVLEQLRRSINQALFLGLFEFEGHLTTYPSGTFYTKHVDQLRGARHRLVSCILYLNEDWQPLDGGALRLYLDEDGDGEHVDIYPDGGTLAVFLSERFHHEVLPARRERMSITGWFRVRE